MADWTVVATLDLTRRQTPFALTNSVSPNRVRAPARECRLAEDSIRSQPRMVASCHTDQVHRTCATMRRLSLLQPVTHEIQRRPNRS